MERSLFEEALSSLIPQGFFGAGRFRWSPSVGDPELWQLSCDLREFVPWPETLCVELHPFRPPFSTSGLGVKTADRSAYLAADEIRVRKNLDDVLLVNEDGVVVEGSISNLIWREGSAWRAVPVRTLGGVEGLALRTLAKAAQKGNNEWRWVAPDLARLRAADGLWLVNAVRGVAPIGQISGWPVDIDVKGTKVLGEWLSVLCE
jgi:branched-subunit amino acid aminotransferase/4-amino-4-deoxychorismate lyase